MFRNNFPVNKNNSARGFPFRLIFILEMQNSHLGTVLGWRGQEHQTRNDKATRSLIF